MEDMKQLKKLATLIEEDMKQDVRQFHVITQVATQAERKRRPYSAQDAFNGNSFKMQPRDEPTNEFHTNPIAGNIFEDANDGTTATPQIYKPHAYEPVYKPVYDYYQHQPPPPTGRTSRLLERIEQTTEDDARVARNLRDRSRQEQDPQHNQKRKPHNYEHVYEPAYDYHQHQPPPPTCRTSQLLERIEQTTEDDARAARNLRARFSQEQDLQRNPKKIRYARNFATAITLEQKMEHLEESMPTIPQTDDRNRQPNSPTLEVTPNCPTSNSPLASTKMMHTL